MAKFVRNLPVYHRPWARWLAKDNSELNEEDTR